MSNDKVSAAYGPAGHGRPRAYLVSDRVLFTQLPEFDQARGTVEEILDLPNPYLVRLDQGCHVAADWLQLSPNPFETTGEHIQHKLADDLYQDWEPAHRRPVRGWTPTPGELGLALGIIALIVFLFVFAVIFYPGW